MASPRLASGPSIDLVFLDELGSVSSAKSKIGWRGPQPVITLVIDLHSGSAHTRSVTILLVCANEERMVRLKDAIHSAGFRLISARGLDEAWTKSDFFDFGAVVIDHDLQDDIAAPAFRQRFITLDVEGNAAPENVAMQLTNLFQSASELVQ